MASDSRGEAAARIRRMEHTVRLLGQNYDARFAHFREVMSSAVWRALNADQALAALRGGELSRRFVDQRVDEVLRECAEAEREKQLKAALLRLSHKEAEAADLAKSFQALRERLHARDQLQRPRTTAAGDVAGASVSAETPTAAGGSSLLAASALSERIRWRGEVVALSEQLRAARSEGDELRERLRRAGEERRGTEELLRLERAGDSVSGAGMDTEPPLPIEMQLRRWKEEVEYAQARVEAAQQRAAERVETMKDACDTQKNALREAKAAVEERLREALAEGAELRSELRGLRTAVRRRDGDFGGDGGGGSGNSADDWRRRLQESEREREALAERYRVAGERMEAVLAREDERVEQAFAKQRRKRKQLESTLAEEQAARQQAQRELEELCGDEGSRRSWRGVKERLEARLEAAEAQRRQQEQEYQATSAKVKQGIRQLEGALAEATAAKDRAEGRARELATKLEHARRGKQGLDRDLANTTAQLQQLQDDAQGAYTRAEARQAALDQSVRAEAGQLHGELAGLREQLAGSRAEAAAQRAQNAELDARLREQLGASRIEQAGAEVVRQELQAAQQSLHQEARQRARLQQRLTKEQRVAQRARQLRGEALPNLQQLRKDVLALRRGVSRAVSDQQQWLAKQLAEVQWRAAASLQSKQLRWNRREAQLLAQLEAEKLKAGQALREAKSQGDEREQHQNNMQKLQDAHARELKELRAELQQRLKRADAEATQRLEGSEEQWRKQFQFLEAEYERKESRLRQQQRERAEQHQQQLQARDDQHRRELQARDEQARADRQRLQHERLQQEMTASLRHHPAGATDDHLHSLQRSLRVAERGAAEERRTLQDKCESLQRRLSARRAERLSLLLAVARGLGPGWALPAHLHASLLAEDGGASGEFSAALRELQELLSHQVSQTQALGRTTEEAGVQVQSLRAQLQAEQTAALTQSEDLARAQADVERLQARVRELEQQLEEARSEAALQLEVTRVEAAEPYKGEAQELRHRLRAVQAAHTQELAQRDQAAARRLAQQKQHMEDMLTLSRSRVAAQGFNTSLRASRGAYARSSTINNSMNASTSGVGSGNNRPPLAPAATAKASTPDAASVVDALRTRERELELSLLNAQQSLEQASETLRDKRNGEGRPQSSLIIEGASPSAGLKHQSRNQYIDQLLNDSAGLQSLEQSGISAFSSS